MTENPHALPAYDSDIDDSEAFERFLPWLTDHGAECYDFHEIRRAYVAHMAQGSRLRAHVVTRARWPTLPERSMGGIPNRFAWCGFYAPLIYGRRDLLYMFGESP